MSTKLMVKAMKVKVGNPLRKLVLIKLADNANDKGECWPSYQHIADQCEMSKRSVMRHIEDLCVSGLLRKEYRLGEKGNSSNIYRLSFSDLVTDIHPSGDTVSPPPSDRESPRICNYSEPVIKSIYGTSVPNERDEASNHAFNTAWNLYPKREGSNPKNKALQAWNARLAEGVTPEEMMSGLTRYIGYCDAKGQTGSSFVMQAARFFGTGREFENGWEVSAYQPSGKKQVDYGDDDDISWIKRLGDAL